MSRRNDIFKQSIPINGFKFVTLIMSNFSICAVAALKASHLAPAQSIKAPDTTAPAEFKVFDQKSITFDEQDFVQKYGQSFQDRNVRVVIATDAMEEVDDEQTIWHFVRENIFKTFLINSGNHSAMAIYKIIIIYSH